MRCLTQGDTSVTARKFCRSRFDRGCRHLCLAAALLLIALSSLSQSACALPPLGITQIDDDLPLLVPASIVGDATYISTDTGI